MALAWLAFEGDTWHGPSLLPALEGVSVEEANVRLTPGTHSIYGIVAHLTGWTGEVTRRLNGMEPAMPLGGDWPIESDCTESLWRELLAELAATQRAFVEAVERFPTERLTEIVGGDRDAPMGTGVSYSRMIHGVLNHTAYHVGQIMMIRDAVEAS